MPTNEPNHHSHNTIRIGNDGAIVDKNALHPIPQFLNKESAHNQGLRTIILLYQEFQGHLDAKPWGQIIRKVCITLDTMKTQLKVQKKETLSPQQPHSICL